MLCVCLPHQHGSSAPTRSLIRHAIFCHIGPPRWVDDWPPYGSVGVRCLSQEHNDAFLSSINMNLYPCDSNLRSYPLSCTAAILYSTLSCTGYKHKVSFPTIQQRNMPQCSVSIELATLQFLTLEQTELQPSPHCLNFLMSSVSYARHSNSIKRSLVSPPLRASPHSPAATFFLALLIFFLKTLFRNSANLLFSPSDIVKEA